jgi:hypothetical protein
MINDFDPEQALARWIALDKERGSRLSAFKATLAQREITSQEKLHLLKVWMTEIDESQKAERTLLLKHFRAAGLSLQFTMTAEGKIWNLVPMPSEIEALWRDRMRCLWKKKLDGKRPPARREKP